ncbi:excalibur calcium-binding domain-containing protein [uncultured Sphingomonas sp.]|uniref:excalibur calcium-binding domain-containing protein n=1 Tax=uncultured Sphingomonas sp. TaxID=158754 RepID=UPI00345DB705
MKWCPQRQRWAVSSLANLALTALIEARSVLSAFTARLHAFPKNNAGTAESGTPSREASGEPRSLVWCSGRNFSHHEPGYSWRMDGDGNVVACENYWFVALI